MKSLHPFDLRATAGNKMNMIDGIVTTKDPPAFHIGVHLILFGTDARPTWISLPADLPSGDTY